MPKSNYEHSISIGRLIHGSSSSSSGGGGGNNNNNNNNNNDSNTNNNRNSFLATQLNLQKKSLSTVNLSALSSTNSINNHNRSLLNLSSVLNGTNSQPITLPSLSNITRPASPGFQTAIHTRSNSPTASIKSPNLPSFSNFAKSIPASPILEPINYQEHESPVKHEVPDPAAPPALPHSRYNSSLNLLSSVADNENKFNSTNSLTSLNRASSTSILPKTSSGIFFGSGTSHNNNHLHSLLHNAMPEADNSLSISGLLALKHGHYDSKINGTNSKRPTPANHEKPMFFLNSPKPNHYNEDSFDKSNDLPSIKSLNLPTVDSFDLASKKFGTSPRGDNSSSSVNGVGNGNSGNSGALSSNISFNTDSGQAPQFSRTSSTNQLYNSGDNDVEMN